MERGVSTTILCIKGVVLNEISLTYMKTLSYDPLNSEHEATGRVFWVNSAVCICTSTFYTPDLESL
jgi:hypothetical protein